MKMTIVNEVNVKELGDNIVALKEMGFGVR